MVTSVGEHVVRDLADLPASANLATPIPTITSALEEATSICASYVGGNATVTPALRSACLRIALYLMGVGRENASEQRKEAYDAAMSWLRDVSKGLANIGDQPPAAVDPGAPQFVVEERLMTRNTLRGIL
jgi:phage gp36-like protein